MTTREDLTGSQARREEEILRKSLVFSPLSHQDFAISGVLYTVPVGQHFSPEIIVNSGSYTKDSEGYISVEKTIHLFERQQDASDFIRDMGKKNITTIKKVKIDRKVWWEIQLINYPNLNFEFSIEDLEERKGYRIEIERSSSFGFENINREVKLSRDGKILSDTYLKYFDIEVNK